MKTAPEGWVQFSSLKEGEKFHDIVNGQPVQFMKVARIIQMAYRGQGRPYNAVDFQCGKHHTFDDDDYVFPTDAGWIAEIECSMKLPDDIKQQGHRAIIAYIFQQSESRKEAWRWQAEIMKYFPSLKYMSFAGPEATIKWLMRQVGGNMTFAKHYQGYGWIKVARWAHDPNKTTEENYIALQSHHVAETTFLVEEIRRLAATADGYANAVLTGLEGLEIGDKMIQMQCPVCEAWGWRESGQIQMDNTGEPMTGQTCTKCGYTAFFCKQVTQQETSDEDKKAYYNTLEQQGKLADVQPGQDLDQLPPGITHVRYPDGSVKRIGFDKG